MLLRSPEELFAVENEAEHKVDYSDLVELPELQEEPQEEVVEIKNLKELEAEPEIESIIRKIYNREATET